MTDTNSTAAYLQRAAERSGFTRERWAEAKIPATTGNLAVCLFLGDRRGEFLFSTALYHRWLAEVHGSKYVVVAGWPGHADLFPEASEYWGLRDVRGLADTAVGFGNTDDKRLGEVTRRLNEFFPHTLPAAGLSEFYSGGLTQGFFDRFKWVVQKMPALPAAKAEVARALAGRAGYKVFLCPHRVVHGLRQGTPGVVPVDRRFWVDLAGELVRAGCCPVVYQDHSAYDISPDLGDKCVYLTEPRLADVLAAMRAAGCVLDVFGGLSRWAVQARTPFVACEDRAWYAGQKEYEIDDLFASDLPHRYIFSFPTLLQGGNWRELVSLVAGRVAEFAPGLDRDRWPVTAEVSRTVSYSAVRRRKARRLGARFFKVPKV